MYDFNYRGRHFKRNGIQCLLISVIFFIYLIFQGLYPIQSALATNTPVTEVNVSPVNLTLGEGATSRLIATVLPLNATNRKVIWSSSTSTIASVDTTGLVTAHASGTATITAKTIDGGFEAYSDITIVVPVTGVTINTPFPTQMDIGSAFQLIATVLPSAAHNRMVFWASNNSAVVDVHPTTGIVTARSAGTANITVTTHEGNFTDRIMITAVPVPVSGVTLVPASANVSVNRTLQITATVLPLTATNKNVIWISSNNNIATVNSTGIVTGRSAGTAIITARTVDGGFEDRATITVSNVPVIGVTIAPLSATMIIGTTSRLTATIDPPDASNIGVAWASSDSAVASVDHTGLVTARTVGDAIITATSVDGNLTASSRITVGSRVTGVTVTPSVVRLSLTDLTQQLTVRVIPADAHNRNVVWSSSNPRITVDPNGLVTFNPNTPGTSGTAVITASTVDGGFTATSNVVIIAVPVASVTLAPAIIPPINLGATQQLTANVLPANATDRSVVWSSSNASVATVSGTGLVRGVGGGSATITVTTNDGGSTASANVTVNVIVVTGVTLAPATANVNIGATQQLTATVAPANASNRNVSWSSSDSSIASVSNAGLVTAYRAGTARITVRTDDGGRTATSAITVTFVPVTGVTLTPANVALLAGAVLQLNATLAPANASNRDLLWTSSDNSVAVVSSNGLLAGIRAGTATITVTTVDGARTATSAVSVTAVPVTGVTLTPVSTTIHAGASQQLTATVVPANASERSVIWSSSNTRVATISNTGLVTAIRAGTATITVRTVDGARTAKSAVTVTGTGTPIPDQLDIINQPVDHGRTTQIEIQGTIEALFPPNSVTGLMPSVSARVLSDIEASPLFNNAQNLILTPRTDLVMLALSGGELDSPARVTMNFDPAIVPAGRVPALFGFNDRTNRWVYIDAQRGAGNLTASVEWLSAFAVFASEPLPAMNDTATHWARNPIVTLAGMDILGGYPDGSFRPDANVSRAEFAAMLTRAIGLESRPQTADRFTDVAGLGWARGAIGAAVDARLMGGYPDGTFGAVRGISRIEIAVIIDRLIAGRHVRVHMSELPVTFADAIPTWARSGVESAARAGIVRGFADNTFRPERIATRAEVAAMLYRLFAEN